MIARTNQTPQINLLFTLDVAINKVPMLEETDPLQEPESKKQQISQDVFASGFPIFGRANLRKWSEWKFQIYLLAF